MTTETTIRPFHVEIPEDELADLRRRILATRWPSKELVEDRSWGVQLATMQALAGLKRDVTRLPGEVESKCGAYRILLFEYYTRRTRENEP